MDSGFIAVTVGSETGRERISAFFYLPVCVCVKFIP